MNHIIIIQKVVVIFLLGFSFSGTIDAQNDTKPKKKLKTYVYFDYFKRTDGSKHLEVIVKAKINKKFELIEDVPINFKYDIGDSIFQLKTITTNNKGIAAYQISSDDIITPNEEGEYKFIAEFEGNKILRPTKKKVKVRDLDLLVNFSMIDSVKTITIEAKETLNDSIRLIDDLDIKIYTQRMFSLLEIGEGSTKNGKLVFKFPDNLPGDSIGSLAIFTLIEEDRIYANVENIQNINWGIPVTERESFKRSFSGGRYISFLFLSMAIAGLIIALFRKKKTE